MNYFRSFDGGCARIKGVKTLYFSGAGTFPQFSAGHRNLPLYPGPNCLLREAIHVSTGSCVTSAQHLVSPYCGGTHVHFYQWCCFSGALSLIDRMKIKELRSLAHKSDRIFVHFTVTKCLCLASEKFILASGSNLSLATGLAS